MLRLLAMCLVSVQLYSMHCAVIVVRTNNGKGTGCFRQSAYVLPKCVTNNNNFILGHFLAKKRDYPYKYHKPNLFDPPIHTLEVGED